MTTQQPSAQPPAQPSAAKEVKAKSKKKMLRGVTAGEIHIQASFNNTIIAVTDTKGNVLVWSSPGHMGFKGSKKSTPFAAQIAAADAAKKAKDMGLETVEVFVKVRALVVSLRSGLLQLQALKCYPSEILHRYPIMVAVRVKSDGFKARGEIHGKRFASILSKMSKRGTKTFFKRRSLFHA